MIKSEKGQLMVETTKLVLDVLKPLRPNILDFTQQLNTRLPGVEITVKVMGVDEKTQDITVTLQGELHYEVIEAELTALGASIHSIDEVYTRYVESTASDPGQ